MIMKERVFLETITKKATLSYLHVPSGGSEQLIARLYSPEHTADAPLIVLFHGFPGKQLNMDWAVQLQSAGYHVLVTSYRGTIGSPGTFRFQHVLEDATATLQHVCSESFTAEHGIKADQVTVVGHSMGGFAGLHAFAETSEAAHYVGISPFNFGLVGQLVLEHPEYEAALHGVLERGAAFLNGAVADALLDELKHHHTTWNLLTLKERLADRSMLLMTSERDETSIKALHHDLLLPDSPFEEAIVDSDHNYIENRDAAFNEWTAWLARQ